MALVRPVVGLTRRSFLVALCALFATPAVATAQTRITGADLRGRVADATGGVLPGATVTATSLETNVPLVVTVDADGSYLIPALAPGAYRVAAELDGFAPQAVGVNLVLGQVADLDFALTVALREAVQVTAERPLVDPTRTAVSSVLEQPDIARLPINGRNFISFAALLPGVTTVDDALPGAASSGLSFLGQRPRTNNLLVDGLDNNDREMGAALASFSQEAVREFQVLTANYAAEFGFATAGVVNIVTKNGTNRWSGSAFEFARHDGLNARDHFERFDLHGAPIDQPKARFRQNQWGGTLGGPIRRDTTFVFGSVERIDIDANNVVTIDPVSAAALTSVGIPVSPGPSPWAFGVTEALGKVSHFWTPNHSTNLRVQYSGVDNENYGNERPGTSGRQSFGGIEARSHGARQLRSDGGAALNQLAVGTRFVSDFGAQLAVEDQKTRALDPTCSGPCDGELEGSPEVTILGAAVAGTHQFEPSSRRSTRLQLKETLSLVRRAHVTKVGFDWIRLSQRSRIPLVFRGAYYFSALPAIPGFLPQALSGAGAVAAGLPVLYVQGYGDSASQFTHHDVAVFAQDEWRATPKLTLSAGLRYQVQAWPGDTIKVSDVGGADYQYSFPQDRNNVALRMSAAFDPRADGRLSWRAGYGRFHGDQLTRLAASTIAHNGRAGVRIRLVSFPDSVIGWNAPGHRLPEPTIPYASSTVSIGPGVESPVSDQATVGVSKVVTDQTAITVDAVWLHGSHLVGALNYNPLVPALGPGRRPNDVNGVPGTSAEVFQYTDFGESWYTGLLAGVRHRASSRLDLRVSYTWSKTDDNSSVFLAHVEDSGLGRNPSDRDGLPLGFDPRREKGPAPNDRRHRGVVSGTLSLPRGASVSAILTAQSGRPFTPLAGADLNGDGLPLADRARLVPTDPSTSVGRNSARLPAEVTCDFRFAKRVGMGRQAGLDLMLEVFNAFNRTNFSEVNDVFGPGAFPTTPLRDEAGRVTYGRYSKALAPRQAQVAARLSF